MKVSWRLKVKNTVFIFNRISPHFYSETVQVPGCDPYREYLFNYLRDQQIWHSLRFWNAALYYALHKEKVPKALPTSAPSAIAEATNKLTQPSVTVNDEDGLNVAANDDDEKTEVDSVKHSSCSVSESSVSSTSASTSNNDNTSDISKQYKRELSQSKNSMAIDGDNDNTTFDTDEQKRQRNMAFSHLG